MNWLKKCFILFIVCLFCYSTVSAQEIIDAAKAGDLVKIKAILAKNPKLIDQTDGRNSTALDFACHRGQRQL